MKNSQFATRRRLRVAISSGVRGASKGMAQHIGAPGGPTGGGGEASKNLLFLKKKKQKDFCPLRRG
jgi:hypothetical protein